MKTNEFPKIDFSAMSDSELRQFSECATSIFDSNMPDGTVCEYLCILLSEEAGHDDFGHFIDAAIKSSLLSLLTADGRLATWERMQLVHALQVLQGRNGVNVVLSLMGMLDRETGLDDESLHQLCLDLHEHPKPVNDYLENSLSFQDLEKTSAFNTLSRFFEEDPFIDACTVKFFDVADSGAFRFTWLENMISDTATELATRSIA